jgi:hypothetical protein
MYKIYKLTSKHSYEVYIGKTKQKIPERKSDHKSAFKKWVNGKISTEKRIKYCSSYEIIRFGNWDMVEIEVNVEPERVEERERYWIENTEDTVNMTIPRRTKRERYHDNPSKILAANKKYYNSHRIEVIAHKRKYRSDNRIEINLRAKRLKHCSMCSKLVKGCYISQHQGKSQRGTGIRCKEAQKARKIIYNCIISKLKINR